MVQNYIRSMVQSSCQVLNWASAELIHSEHIVVCVGDAINVVFKDVNTEGMIELCRDIYIYINFKIHVFHNFSTQIRMQLSLDQSRVIVSMESNTSGATLSLCHSTVLDAVYSHNCVTAIKHHAADQ